MGPLSNFLTFIFFFNVIIYFIKKIINILFKKTKKRLNEISNYLDILIEFICISLHKGFLSFIDFEVYSHDEINIIKPIEKNWIKLSNNYFTWDHTKGELKHCIDNLNINKNKKVESNKNREPVYWKYKASKESLNSNFGTKYEVFTNIIQNFVKQDNFNKKLNVFHMKNVRKENDNCDKNLIEILGYLNIPDKQFTSLKKFDIFNIYHILRNVINLCNHTLGFTDWRELYRNNINLEKVRVPKLWELIKSLINNFFNLFLDIFIIVQTEDYLYAIPLKKDNLNSVDLTNNFDYSEIPNIMKNIIVK